MKVATSAGQTNAAEIVGVPRGVQRTPLMQSEAEPEQRDAEAA
jgi:hypothetical protein